MASHPQNKYLDPQQRHHGKKRMHSNNLPPVGNHSATGARPKRPRISNHFHQAKNQRPLHQQALIKNAMECSSQRNVLSDKSFNLQSATYPTTFSPQNAWNHGTQMSHHTTEQNISQCHHTPYTGQNGRVMNIKQERQDHVESYFTSTYEVDQLCDNSNDYHDQEVLLNSTAMYKSSYYKGRDTLCPLNNLVLFVRLYLVCPSSSHTPTYIFSFLFASTEVI